MKTIQQASEVLVGKTGLFPNSRGNYTQAEFICIKGDKISCKANEKKSICKFDESSSYFFEYSEEFEPILGPKKKYYIADATANLHLLSPEVFETIQESKKAGAFITDILPDTLKVTFFSHSDVPVSQVEGKELSIKCVLNAENGIIKFLEPKLAGNLPFKFSFYKCGEYNKCVKEFHKDMEKVLEELAISPEENAPLIKIDFAALQSNDIPESCFIAVANSIHMALNTIIEVILSIIRASETLSQSELNTSLTYNFNKRGEAVEKINIGKKLINYLLTNQIILRLSIDKIVTEESILTQEKNIINWQIPFQREKDGRLISILPENCQSIVYKSILTLFYNSELIKLKEAIGNKPAAMPTLNLEEPLGNTYSEAIFYATKLIYPAKFEIDTTESSVSIDQLRLLMALPKFMEHLGNAFRHLQNISENPSLAMVRIFLKNGVSKFSPAFTVKIADSTLNIILHNYHSNLGLIPSENELIESILREKLKPESAISEILYCSAINEKGLPEGLRPYIESSELHTTSESLK